MKFQERIAQLAAQVRAVMGKLTPTQRMSVMLLAGVVAVSFVILILVNTAGTTGRYVNLFYKSLAPEQQSYVIQKLAAQEFKIEDGVIKVPEKDRERLAAMFLEDPAIYQEPDWFSSLFEPNILETDTLRDKKFTVAREKQLASIITHFKEVKRAAVGINPGENRIFMNTDLVRPTAFVTVDLKPGVDSLGRDTVNAIAGTVSGAIKGLRMEDVRISDYNGKTYRPRPRENGVPDGNERLEITRKISEYYEQKIYEFLNFPGAGVAVYPEVNWDKVEQKISTYPNIEEATYTEQEHVSAGGSESNGGEVGVSPNVGESMGVNESMSVGSSGGPAPQNPSSSRTKITRQFDKLNETIKLIEQYPGKFDTKTVAVNVPYKFLAAPLSGGPPPEDPQEREKVVQSNIDNLREQIKRTVGLGNTPEDDARVYVAAKHSFEPAEAAPPALGDTFWQYSQPLIGKIAVAGFALLALILVASLVRRNIPKPQQIPIEEIEERIEQEVAKEKKDFVAEMEKLDDKELKAVQVKERVHDMVTDNPSGAASLLKSWINKEE